MIKTFTAVLTFCTMGLCLANDYHTQSALNTKNLVRMKLWYDGISMDNSINTVQKAKANKVQKPLSEELERALGQISL